MEIIFSEDFEKDFKKIKNHDLRLRLLKQLKKIDDQPEADKPLKYQWKNHRSIRIPPFRIIYRIEENKIIINCFDHRKTVY